MLPPIDTSPPAAMRSPCTTPAVATCPPASNRVARDRIGQVERAARAEVVRAELLRHGVVALALEAAACDEQAQGEHAQGPCDRFHIGSPRLPPPCRTGTRGILQAIADQSRASPRTRIWLAGSARPTVPTLRRRRGRQQRKSRDSLSESRLFRRTVFHDGPQTSPGRALPVVCRPVSPSLRLPCVLRGLRTGVTLRRKNYCIRINSGVSRSLFYNSRCSGLQRRPLGHVAGKPGHALQVIVLGIAQVQA